jgi:membrane-associated protease RseP (regulator of RpoE activity)
MINLLPLGQLDGGHIIYGLFGRRQKLLAILFLISLLGLGFLWNGWWIWMVLALIMRPFHPAVMENDLPLDKRHKKIGWLAVALFILTFMPVPIFMQ